MILRLLIRRANTPVENPLGAVGMLYFSKNFIFNLFSTLRAGYLSPLESYPASSLCITVEHHPLSSPRFGGVGTMGEKI